MVQRFVQFRDTSLVKSVAQTLVCAAEDYIRMSEKNQQYFLIADGNKLK